MPTDTALEWNIPIWLVLLNHENSIKQTKFNINTVGNHYCLMSFHWGRTGPKNLQTKNTSSLYLLTTVKNNRWKMQKNIWKAIGYFKNYNLLWHQNQYYKTNKNLNQFWRSIDNLWECIVLNRVFQALKYTKSNQGKKKKISKRVETCEM